MLNGKYISIKRIIEEIYGDNQLDYTISYEDIIRWTAQVLSIMNIPDIYVAKVTGHISNPHLDITNYKAELPCDLFKLRQISVDGYPCVRASNTFSQLMDGDCCGVNLLGTVDGDNFIDQFGNTFNTSLGFPEGTGSVGYDINNNFITLSVKTGKVCLAYWAFPTDEDGFPMIPDNQSFIEAVKMYCRVKIDYQEWRKDPSNSGLKALYEDSKQEYAWYVGQASNAAKIPDLDKMEGIKNQMLRLKPRVNEHDSFYKFMNQPERRYNR